MNFNETWYEIHSTGGHTAFERFDVCMKNNNMTTVPASEMGGC
jgi:hypothetical protein